MNPVARILAPIACWLVFAWASVLLGADYIEDPLGGPLRLPPAERVSSRFTVHHWTVADGLPRQGITAVAQTGDRYLWCSTGDSLVRYDGHAFKVYPCDEIPALEGLWIRRLFCDRDGRLWIFARGWRVAVLEGGVFRRFGVEDGLPEDGARPSVRSATGECWLAGQRAGDFYRYDGRRFVPFEVPGLRDLRGPEGGRPWKVSRVWADSGGPRWAIMDAELRISPDGEKVLDRHLVRIDPGGNCEVVEVQDKGGPIFELAHFFQFSDGRPGLTSRDGIYALADGECRAHLHFELPLVKTHGGPVETFQDEVGDFWIGTYYGGLVLCQRDGTTRHFVLPEERRRPNVPALTGSASDGIWAISNDGLYHIRRRVIASWTQQDGIPQGGVTVFAEGGVGRMWVGFDDAVVAIEDESIIGIRYDVPLDYIIHGVQIGRIYQGGGGVVWVGLRRFRKDSQLWQAELWRIDSEGFGFVTVVPDSVLSLRESDAGTLLVGTTTGLFRLEGDRLAPVEIPSLGGTEGRIPVSVMLGDVGGGVVVGLYGKGLFRYEHGRWTDLCPGGEDEGFSIASMSAGSDGELWIAGEDDGLALWREGRWHSLAGLGDRLPRTVNAVSADVIGGVWLASDSGEGLIRFERDELLRWIDDPEVNVAGVSFRREDGLPSLIVHSRDGSMLRDSQGKLWVATTLGAAVVDPEEWSRIRDYALPPQVHIQRVALNDQPVRERVSGDASGGEIIVPAGPRRIEFDYAAVEFASPAQVRYRYLLEGYEGDWIDAGDRTVAVYPDLPPGRYTFRVAVNTGVGEWSENAVGTGIWVQPHWWERPVSRVIAGLLIAAILLAVYLRKLRRVSERGRQQEKFSLALIRSQEDERKRLANELHDGLGHELLVLKGSLERESNLAGGAGAERIGELSGKAAEVVQQVREISHDLRPPELERFGLGPALESAVTDTAKATGIHVETEIEDFERLAPDAELGLFRIAQEALSNMAKHSDASDGKVGLRVAGGEVLLMLEDDGRGFDERVLARARGTGGLGLSGIEERARLLGGSVQFVSRRTNGARVTVRVPIERNRS